MNVRVLPLFTLVAAFAACSGDDGGPPPAPSQAGAGGRSGGSGAAGTGGGGRAGQGAGGQTLPSGGSSSAGAGAGGKAAGQGGTSSAGAAGNSGGLGGSSLAGSGGSKGGAAGGPTYPTDANPGPNVIPTSCAYARGKTGCCGPDGNAYRGDFYLGVVKEECSPQAPCRWMSWAYQFQCGGDQDEAPGGALTPDCAVPLLPKADCPDIDCEAATGCDQSIWGEGAHCVIYNPETGKGWCLRCEKDADCAADRFCDPDVNICRPRACTSDAACAAMNPAKPACEPKLHTCQECTKDSHCPGVGMGCFVNSCGCKTDAACTTSPLGRWCDTNWHDCGCRTAADCGPEAPRCVESACSACANDDDCTSGSGKPYCVRQGLAHACVACRKDTDCPDADKPFCSQGACVAGCQTSFSCAGAFPVCQFAADGVGACGPAPVCDDDDDHEAGDDNPLTALSALPIGGSATGRVCGLPGERDHYRITLTGTSDIVLQLTSDDSAVFVALSDAQGRLLGLSMHGSPQKLHVRALAAGTYYAVVGVAVADGGPKTSAYTLQASGGGTPCVTDASCAEVTPTEIYRGRCESASGACAFIDGKGALGPADPCDDDTDCATGFCGGYAFTDNPAASSRCSAVCDGPSGLGQVPSSELCDAAGLDSKWVCTTFEAVNRCVLRCTKDDDCPVVDVLASPPSGATWLHMTCSPTGHCEYYE